MIHTNIPKNQEFTVLLQSAVAFSNTTSYLIEPRNGTNLALGTPQVAKDGGSFTAATNAAVFVAPGIARLTLTAAEMNADKVEVYITNNSGDKFSMAAVLYTDGFNPGSGGGITAQDVWEYGTRELTASDCPTAEEVADEVWASDSRSLTANNVPGVANFTQGFLNILMDGFNNEFDLVDTELGNNDYNYYGLRHKNDTYLIVKESIVDQSLTYAHAGNNNGMKYPNAWASRLTVTYSGTQDVI